MAERDCVGIYQDFLHDQPQNLLAHCDIQRVGPHWSNALNDPSATVDAFPRSNDRGPIEASIAVLNQRRADAVISASWTAVWWIIFHLTRKYAPLLHRRWIKITPIKSRIAPITRELSMRTVSTFEPTKMVDHHGGNELTENSRGDDCCSIGARQCNNTGNDPINQRFFLNPTTASAQNAHVTVDSITTAW
jgi:hypothetical protein